MTNFIDPEMEKIALEMGVGVRKSLDKILLESGMTPEEIQKTVEEALSEVYINGVPLHAIACPNCQGRGWVKPEKI